MKIEIENNRPCGKSFGALKSAVIRIIRKGYAPEWTQITVSVSDRERLRMYCASNGCKSMLEGFNKLLTQAGVNVVVPKSRKGGRLETLVNELKVYADEFDSEALSEKVKAGRYDDFIKDNAQTRTGIKTK